jgi:hypothetical protein
MQPLLYAAAVSFQNCGISLFKSSFNVYKGSKQAPTCECGRASLIATVTDSLLVPVHCMFITMLLHIQLLLQHTAAAAAARSAFIIKELDDTHLLVKEDMVDFVQEQVKAFNNKNVYTPPVPIE